MNFLVIIWLKLQFLLLVLYFVTIVGVVRGVHINELKVPPLIRNASEEFVTLDCDYSLEDNEKAGLVVKWYFNNEESPVYQWIPFKKPQDLGILKGRLNLDYKASEDEYKVHRALRIIRPITNLSGKYVCRVSTLFNDAYKSGSMLVYSPQKDMGIKVSGTRLPGYVNVSCWATGVYPEPRLALYYGENGDQKIDEMIVEIKWVKGAYDIRGYKIMRETNISTITSLFDCELTIPNTDYIVRKGTLYEPGSLELRDGSMAGGCESHVKLPPAFLRVLIILASFYLTINSFSTGQLLLL